MSLLRCLTGLLTLVALLFPARAPAELAYYSDYLSFAGRDERGFVLFALDTNRGIDGDDYQAEHFTVLYDQQLGWVKLAGNGAYDNPGQLAGIPDSPAFRFTGTPATGLTLRSPPNELQLEIAPLPERLRDDADGRRQYWGSAGAVLSWQGRRIPGRVIYEYLVRQNWNRLTHRYPGSWDNFQGFYLRLDPGTGQPGEDLYLRSQGDGERRRSRGFADIGAWSGTLSATRLEAGDKAFTFGFYRWPQRWEIDLAASGDREPSGHLSLRQLSRNNIGNWVIGGFAMSVVQGELQWRGARIPVLGFAELIK